MPGKGKSALNSFSFLGLWQAVPVDGVGSLEMPAVPYLEHRRLCCRQTRLYRNHKLVF